MSKHPESGKKKIINQTPPSPPFSHLLFVIGRLKLHLATMKASPLVSLPTYDYQWSDRQYVNPQQGIDALVFIFKWLILCQ